MGKITKATAENVANKMADKIYSEKINNMKKLLIKISNEEINKAIPKDLMESFNKYKAYFTKSTCVRFIADTLDNLRIDNLDLFPSKDNWYPSVVISRNKYEEILSVKEEIIKCKEERNTLYEEIYSTILSLGTSNKIKEFLPEAIPFFPIEDKQIKSLSLPIEKLKEMFK